METIGIESVPENAHIHIDINVESIDYNLGTTVRRSVEKVACCLQAMAAFAPNNFHLPGVMLQLQTGAAQTSDQVKADAQLWVLINGVRDIIESLGACLEESRVVAAACRLSKSGKIAAATWTREVDGPAHEFHELGLPGKFRYLNSEFGINPVIHLAYVTSINRARNCLVHRFGRVGSKDVNNEDDDAMIMSWRTFQLLGPRGEPIDGPTVLMPGESISGQLQERTRTFKLGEQVLFSAEEFSQIALTVWLMGKEIVEEIGKIFTQPSAPT